MGPRHRWGEILVSAGILSQDELLIALERQRQAPSPKPRLGTIIVEAGFASELSIAKALASQLELPYVDLSTVSFDSDLTSLVPRWLAERHALVPVEHDETNGLFIVMADPTNLVAIDDVRMSARIPRVKVGVAPISAIQDARDRIYAVDAAASEVLKRLGVATEVEVIPEESDADEDDLTAQRDDEVMVPIISLTNALLADAVRARATDVHIEPSTNDVEVRYRVDGLLREVMSLPKHIQGLVVSRLKIMSGMDIAERRRPQDGRSRIRVDRREVDTRVSTIPTLGGEKVVIRLLYKADSTLHLESLGMAEDQKTLLEHHLVNPQGLIVFTGPTGSGKTSTMYGALKQIESSEKNMVTLEDPIEYELPFLNQTQVDQKTGITFARGLRTILRQDPDVIMVGEIRDAETAEIVMQSALTGHLVLSSLHTNDATSAITRLLDLGIEPFLISSALSLVVAQRLVRVICDNCKEEADLSERTLTLLNLSREEIEGATFMKGAGCELCGYTGYRGRTGLFEVLPITTAMREQISGHISETALTYAVRAAGIMGLRDAGLKKAEAGITTLEEVLRVTYTEREEIPRCPSCRQEVEPTFVVCPYCQADLTAQSCSECGREMHSDWKVCPYCRADQPELHAHSDKERILIVDDDEDLRMVVKTRFENDYEILEASTGEEGVRLATLMRPDLILLDLRLPDTQGTDVARRLRQTASTSMIPLIMLTGTGDESSELESLRAGVDDYLTKPFDWETLSARMDKVMHQVRKPPVPIPLDIEKVIAPPLELAPSAPATTAPAPAPTTAGPASAAPTPRSVSAPVANRVSPMVELYGSEDLESQKEHKEPEKASTPPEAKPEPKAEQPKAKRPAQKSAPKRSAKGAAERKAKEPPAPPPAKAKEKEKVAPQPAKAKEKAAPSTNGANGLEERATIQFKMSEPATVTVTILNESGILVKTLLSEKRLPAGMHAIRWDGTNNGKQQESPGTYTYEIDAISADTGGSAVLKGTTKIKAPH